MSASLPSPAATIRERIQGQFVRGDYPALLSTLAEQAAVASMDTVLLNFQARALDRLGRFDEALAVIDRSLAIHSENPEEVSNRASLLTKLGRKEEAVHALDDMLSSHPRFPDGWVQRALLLYQLGRRDRALKSAERAVEIEPTHLAALNMRGMILDDLGRRDEALADFHRALAVNPNYAEAITNLGVMYGRSGESHRALECYERSIGLQPDQTNALYNRAVLKLLHGDWLAGFEEFDIRWRLFPHEAARLTRLAPLWRGQCSIAGKTLLLHHEQGFGDTLQFVRYAIMVESLGAQVVIAAPRALVGILRSLPGKVRIVSEGDPIPGHDFHVPLMSLPVAFGSTPATAPNRVPYLFAEHEGVRAWEAKLPARTRPRIGIAWSGRRFPPINHARDMSLKLIEPLLRLDADFVCLHTELNEGEIETLRAYPNVSMQGLAVKDFADTAALMANLDLVISVDTAVAHLAGALGRPVWVMNRFASCWRWLLQREDTPWYPTLRLFRQPRLGDWPSVVAAVCEAAVGFMKAFKVPATSSIAGVQSRPNLPELLQAALDLHHGGRLGEATLAYEQVLARDRDCVHGHHYLGIASAQRGDRRRALLHLGRARELSPDDVTVLTHYGNVLTEAGRIHDALSVYQQAIAIAPDHADAHYNLGVAYLQSDRLPDAVRSLREAVRCHGTHAKALNNLGNACLGLGELGQALDHYLKASEADPRLVEAWVNRCHVLRRLYRAPEALRAGERALALRADSPEALNATGAVHLDEGEDSCAEALFERALALSPDHPEAAWNLGLLRLAQGRYREGWRLHEARWRVKSLGLPKGLDALRPSDFDHPAGRTFLLHAEQGYGDTVQFCRYAAALASQGARVTVSVPDALVRLIRRLPCVDAVVAQRSAVAGGRSCSLMSLPFMLHTTSSIPSADGYLSADGALAAHWRERMNLAPGLKVGFAWAGRPTHQNDARRSTRLADWQALLRHKAQWVSLQQVVPDVDAPLLQSRTSLTTLRGLEDFADTAAVIANLDLVITVDTAVAHLAGALGKPVWILLPRVADWRWLREGTVSPWYASARLFRQTAASSWSDVFSSLEHALELL